MSLVSSPRIQSLLFTSLKNNLTKMAKRSQSSDMEQLRKVIKSAKKIVFLSGAGMSAESGIPTFRGAGGYWRKYQATSLATPEAFKRDPGLVWEFYHYRREVAAKAQPNPGHIAVAEYEKRHPEKDITVLTQNVDGLHRRAGSKNMLEIHGCLYKTRCTNCSEVLDNNDSPICAALAGRGAPDMNPSNYVPKEQLPHCKKPECKGLLRPHIVWFGESLDPEVLSKADAAMEACEVCILIGTSNVVYPSAGFAKNAALRGAVVAEFNIEPTGDTHQFSFFFEGPCGKMLPLALNE